MSEKTKSMLKSDTENISKLKFLASIEKDQKIDVNHLKVCPNNIFTSVSRTLKGNDTRENTITFIKNTISNAFDIINNYMNSDKVFEKEQVKPLIQDLINTRVSLQNLQYTYSDDVMFVCKLKTYIQSIDSKIKEIQVNSQDEYGELIKNLTLVNHDI